VQVEISRLARILRPGLGSRRSRPAPLAPAQSEIAQTAPGEEIRTMLEGALGVRGRACWRRFTRSQIRK